MATTVLDIITDALIDIGSLSQGETANASEAEYCRRKLNDLLDRSNADRLSIFNVGQKAYTLVFSGKSAYQIGVGAADFADPRPTLIQNARLILAGIGHPLELLNAAQWSAIAERGLIGNLPMKLYCDYGYPIANLNLWPIPSCASNTQLEIFTWTPIAQFASINDTVSFPPAYIDYLKYGLAVKIAPSFGVPMDQMQAIIQIAAGAKQAVQNLNAQFLETARGQASTGEAPTIGAPTFAPAAPPAAPPQQ